MQSCPTTRETPRDSTSPNCAEDELQPDFLDIGLEQKMQAANLGTLGFGTYSDEAEGWRNDIRGGGIDSANDHEIIGCSMIWQPSGGIFTGG